MRPDYFVRIGRGFRLAALFCCFCLTGYSAFRASEGTGPLETAAVARESVATPDRVRSYASVTQFIPVEQLLVGQRVRSDNPAAGVDLQFGADIIPSEWRKLTLRAPKRDGTVADVVLLRPLTWLNQQRGEVGGTVFISVPECGIDGNAEVLEIDPCPEILPGEGRVITGTFRHQVLASISLSIAGQAEPILCTGNHPFWSEDRQDFVRADSLQPNETLRTATGTTTVTSLSYIPGSTAVYNLEIHGTHVYHVGTSGVLVHNGDPGDCIEFAEEFTARFGGDAKSMIPVEGAAYIGKIPGYGDELWNVHAIVIRGGHIFDSANPLGIEASAWIAGFKAFNQFTDPEFRYFVQILEGLEPAKNFFKNVP